MTTAQEIDTAVAGQTVVGRFLANLAANSEQTVLRWKSADGSWSSQTLGEMAGLAQRLATGFQGLGVGKGDRVVLMLSNRAEFHALDLAVLLCGATPVSIYNSSAPEQIDYLVNHCQAKVAVLENTTFLARFDKVRANLRSLQHIALIEPGTADGVLRYADLAANEPIDLDTAVALGEPTDLATIIYTSGTTGNPKGVMLSNRNVCWTLESVGGSMREQVGINSLTGLRHISYLPLAHIMERLLGHYYLLEFATEVSCCPETGKVAAYVAEVHPQVFIGVPRVWEKFYAGVSAALAADPEKSAKFAGAVAMAGPIVERVTDGTATDEDRATWAALDAAAFQGVKAMIGLDQAKMCISGAAPLASDVMTWFRSLGVPLSEGYGMSETTAVLTWSHAAKAGHVGRPALGVEVKLGEDGEVLARGGNMFEGYLDNPEQTADTKDADGWVHTGDIGELDDEGYLKIVDRKKELIITAGGKNISPANLEAALKTVPLVGQACAIGDQRPFVTALVVLDPDAAKQWAASHGLSGDEAAMPALAARADVIAEIEEGVAAVMRGFNNAESVKKVTVLGEEWLPDTDLLTPTSKLKRRGLHAHFAAEIESMY
jgi:long-chain acyl-CoA synthetase